jgi:enoyl-CoA hydratase/carnithine racemase
MLMTGDFITAEQALDKGLVNAVVAPEQLDAAVQRYVESILAKPRTAVAIGKKLFYEQLEQPLEAAYQNAEHAMACNMMDEAALEGVQAFIDKRAPSWKTR